MEVEWLLAFRKCDMWLAFSVDQYAMKRGEKMGKSSGSEWAQSQGLTSSASQRWMRVATAERPDGLFLYNSGFLYLVDSSSSLEWSFRYEKSFASREILYVALPYYIFCIAYTSWLKKTKKQSCWKSWVHPAWYVIWGDLEKRRKCIVAHLRQTWRSRSTSAGDRLYRLPLTIFKDTNRRTGPLENLLEVLLRFSKDLHVYLVL